VTIIHNIKELPEWRQKIIDAATRAIGSRYHKDACVPPTESSVGIFDCVQFVAWCYEQALGYPLNVPLQGTCVGFTDNRMSDYITKYNAQRLNLDLSLPGDVLFFNYGGTSHHSGLVYPSPEGSNEKWMVHTSATHRKTSAHSLSGEWAPGRRFHSAWSLAHLFEDT
jgi:cell wall-associated NlpC family hydrolase